MRRSVDNGAMWGEQVQISEPGWYCNNADRALLPEVCIGYTQLWTDLPGGRHDNVRTMRAVTMRADGSGRQFVARELASDPNAWTQFAGWSPDGRQAIIYRGWQDPENASGKKRTSSSACCPAHGCSIRVSSICDGQGRQRNGGGAG